MKAVTASKRETKRETRNGDISVNFLKQTINICLITLILNSILYIKFCFSDPLQVILTNSVPFIWGKTAVFTPANCKQEVNIAMHCGTKITLTNLVKSNQFGYETKVKFCLYNRFNQTGIQTNLVNF